MFILYAVFIGVIAGLVLGGDATRLTQVRFHWKAVVFGGLLLQAVLFAPAVADVVGDLGPWLYVASTAAVLATVVRNGRIAGLPVVALGAFSNLAAIVANGGYMPVSLEALAAMGKAPPPGYSNSALVTSPALQPLTDIFALPRWLPFTNVYSIGDVLIGVGVMWAIVAVMRTGRLGPSPATVLRVGPAAVRGMPDRLASVRRLVRTGGATRQLPLVTRVRGTPGPFAAWDSRRTVADEEHQLLHWKSVQGKPVVRRGTQS
jgi:hypothetical protein